MGLSYLSPGNIFPNGAVLTYAWNDQSKSDSWSLNQSQLLNHVELIFPTASHRVSTLEGLRDAHKSITGSSNSGCFFFFACMCVGAHLCEHTCVQARMHMDTEADGPPWMSLFRKQLFFAFFWDRVSLCSPGCPGTHFVDQAGLEFRNLPASASRVLGLKACATTPGREVSW